jgi:hypothetical protein
VGLQIPEGVVRGLVVAGIALRGGAVLQQHHGHREDHVAQLEVLVKNLRYSKLTGF